MYSSQTLSQESGLGILSGAGELRSLSKLVTELHEVSFMKEEGYGGERRKAWAILRMMTLKTQGSEFRYSG